MEFSSTKHEIIIGRKQGPGLSNVYCAGHAFLREGDEFYTVKLMMFPGQTYYISKNKDSHDRYTVFAKQINSADRMKFQNPVGSGRLSREVPSYMEIYFPIFRSQIFMNLFPSNK